MRTKDTVRAVVIGAVTFIAVAALSRLITGGAPWVKQVALKTALALAALALIKFRGGPLADYGFRRAQAPRWLRSMGGGAAIGAMASFLVLIAGGQGMSGVVKGYSPLQLLLVVGLYSSLTEEIFTRGWLQSSLAQWKDDVYLGIPYPAWVSGLFFGSMHLSLIMAGVDAVTCTVIPIATACLGLWCGVIRERTLSVWPAVAAHVAFNLGSPLGAMLYVVIYRIQHGVLPQFAR